MTHTAESCQAKDTADELAAVRERFVLPAGKIYLDGERPLTSGRLRPMRARATRASASASASSRQRDAPRLSARPRISCRLTGHASAGNSLGPLPKGVTERVTQVIEKEWGDDLITSWNINGWIDHPLTVGDKIAELVGGGKGNVVVADSTSVNLFKALGAGLALRPGRSVIISEDGNFPTDLYMIQGMLALLKDSHELKTVTPEKLAGTLGSIGETIAAVCLTHINYKTGKMYDMAAITKAVQATGALMIWDLAHSAGAVPVDLLGAGADMAFGCGYKYLNGGPGAPSFIFVNPSLQEQAVSPLAGWLGHARPFAFVPNYEPAPGIARFICGTPQVLSLVALDVALGAWEGVTMDAVRSKSVALCELFVSLVETRCADWVHETDGLQLVSPRDSSVRGSQISFSHPEGYAIMQALIAQGVIGDFRAPYVIASHGIACCPALFLPHCRSLKIFEIMTMMMFIYRRACRMCVCARVCAVTSFGLASRLSTRVTVTSGRRWKSYARF
jgi:kynureninase